MDAYAGLDLHGNNVYCSVIDEKDQRLCEKRVPCEVARIVEVLAPYQDRLKGVVVESTFNWYWLVDALMERNYAVHLASPNGMVRYAGLKHEDDRSDAFLLGHLLRLGILPEGYIYPKKERPVRDLLRRRMKLKRVRTAQVLSLECLMAREKGLKIGIREIHQLDEAAVRQLLAEPHLETAAIGLLRHINFIDAQTAEIEKQVEAQAETRLEYDRLQTLPGIGKILAMTILLESGEISRFPGAGEYASYCRAVRSERSSNGKKKGQGNTKNGNAYLAWAFVEAANFMARFSPEAKRYIERKMARAPRVVAVKSLAAKIAKACYFVMRDGVEFDMKKMFG